MLRRCSSASPKRKLGWVTTRRGRGGGISLGVAAHQLRLGDVLRGLEESDQLIDCADPPCALRGGCRLKQALDDGLASFYTTMNRYTLAGALLAYAANIDRPAALAPVLSRIAHKHRRARGAAARLAVGRGRHHADALGAQHARRARRMFAPYADAEFFLCGPTDFMREPWRSLVAHGVSPTRLHREVFAPDLLDALA